MELLIKETRWCFSVSDNFQHSKLILKLFPTVKCFCDIKTFLPIEAKSKFPVLKRKCHNFDRNFTNSHFLFYLIFKMLHIFKDFFFKGFWVPRRRIQHIFVAFSAHIWYLAQSAITPSKKFVFGHLEQFDWWSSHQNDFSWTLFRTHATGSEYINLEMAQLNKFTCRAPPLEERNVFYGPSNLPRVFTLNKLLHPWVRFYHNNPFNS